MYTIVDDRIITWLGEWRLFGIFYDVTTDLFHISQQDCGLLTGLACLGVKLEVIGRLTACLGLAIMRTGIHLKQIYNPINCTKNLIPSLPRTPEKREHVSKVAVKTQIIFNT